MKKVELKPVWKEINVDSETPVSAFLKLKRIGAKFLLESVEKGEKGRIKENFREAGYGKIK